MVEVADSVTGIFSELCVLETVRSLHLWEEDITHTATKNVPWQPKIPLIFSPMYNLILYNDIAFVEINVKVVNKSIFYSLQTQGKFD